MDGKLDPHKVGLALGSVLGLWHAIWSVLVAIGLAKPLLDFILSLHFLEFSYSLRAFSLTTAVFLVAVTSAIGYVVGWILAASWNRVSAK